MRAATWRYKRDVMAQNYMHIMFSKGARTRQMKAGSYDAYARMMAGATGQADLLGPRELDFIAARDSFYLSSVAGSGWPYIQHRGGLVGFLKSLGGNRLGFADFRGNKQFISTANLAENDRVALFLMDYPGQARLKLIGHAQIVERGDDPALVDALMTADYRAVPERALVIDVIGFDWNCPQHIVPRYTEAEISQGIAPLVQEIEALRAEIVRLKSTTD